jgi:hypothetical protein
MPSSVVLRRVALVRTDVSEERTASIIRMKRIGELWTLSVTSNRRTLWRNTSINYSSSPILITLTMAAIPPKRRFLQKPRGVTFQKTAFFIVTIVTTSNVAYFNIFSRLRLRLPRILLPPSFPVKTLQAIFVFQCVRITLPFQPLDHSNNAWRRQAVMILVTS